MERQSSTTPSAPSGFLACLKDATTAVCVGKSPRKTALENSPNIEGRIHMNCTQLLPGNKRKNSSQLI